MKKSYLLLSLLVTTLIGFGKIRLPAIIANNMVMQQQSVCTLWGWSEPGETIVVTTSWNQHSDSVKASRDANWQIKVTTPRAGGPFIITFKGSNTIVLNNILIGEVWICSGQSNMEMSDRWLPRKLSSISAGDTISAIHFFHLPKTTAAHPQDNCTGQWVAADTNELKNFSLVGYSFGKTLHQSLNVPIGLIEVAWGGTPAEVWVPKEKVIADSSLSAAAGKQVPSDGWPYSPGLCYNAMILPIAKFQIAGAIWYQGEGNVGTAGTYGKLLETLIQSWRTAWGKELPFYYVQIAPFAYGNDLSAALLRENQDKVQELPGTGMVVISDLVEDTANIHPQNKRDVGLRLADWALADTYRQRGIIYKSPSLGKAMIQGATMRVQVKDAPQGLIFKGIGVQQLFIAGTDKIFYPAKATLKGDMISVYSPAVRNPIAVRYQFSNAGIGNIYNAEGLPLAPFRTDNWALSLK